MLMKMKNIVKLISLGCMASTKIVKFDVLKCSSVLANVAAGTVICHEKMAFCFINGKLEKFQVFRG